MRAELEDDRMPLFRKSDDKVARDEAARAEFERLTSLPVDELAKELMPAFGPDGARAGKEINSLQASNWLMRSYPRGAGYVRQLHAPVCEGIQRLEHAGLVEVLGGKRGSVATGAHVRATRLGTTALADGDVERYVIDPGRT
jgi:hypothetical protein